MSAQTSKDRKIHKKSANLEGTVTRPANATQYTANDVVGTATTCVIELTGAAASLGFGGTIKGLKLTKSDPDTTSADFDVYIFHTAPTAIADHAAFSTTAAHLANRVCMVRFTSAGDVHSSTVADCYDKSPLNCAYVCETASTSLYAVIVARSTYTPASGEVFYVNLLVEWD